MLADNDSKSSPPAPAAQSTTKPMTSFLVSLRFKAFTFKGLPAEAEPVMSPTLILDHSKPFSPFKNPIWCEEAPFKSSKCFPAENKHSWEKLDSKGIGVALIDDAASDEPSEDDSSTFISKASNRVVLSGTKLRVQTPPLPNCTLSPFRPPILNPQISTRSSNSGNQTNVSPQNFTGFLSMSEMELSEDYTCVISHGPNPTTTHIFGNCIVDKCCFLSDKSNSSPKDFLSFCHTC